MTRRRVLAAYADLSREPAGKGWAMVELAAVVANDGDPLVDALKRTRADVIAKMRAAAVEGGRVDAGWTTLLASVHTAIAAVEAAGMGAAND